MLMLNSLSQMLTAHRLAVDLIRDTGGDATHLLVGAAPSAWKVTVPCAARPDDAGDLRSTGDHGEGTEFPAPADDLHHHEAITAITARVHRGGPPEPAEHLLALAAEPGKLGIGTWLRTSPDRPPRLLVPSPAASGPSETLTSATRTDLPGQAMYMPARGGPLNGTPGQVAAAEHRLVTVAPAPAPTQIPVTP